MRVVGASVAWTAAEIAEKAADADWVGKTRLRLRSLSWFAKCIAFLQDAALLT